MPRLWIGLGTLGRSRSDALAISFTALLAFAAGAAYIALAVVRWQSLETNAFDLAFFDQIVFNTSQGRWFETSFVEYNFAGQHLEPILLAFVPGYWLGGGPLLLTTTQAAVAAAAAFPLYHLARRLGLSSAIAVASVAAYLANPYLLRAVGFDFHPEVMAALPAFTAAWAIASGRTRLAVAATLSLLLFKEDTVFLVLALAGFMWLRGQRRPAAGTAVVGLGYAIIAVFLIMPAIRDGQPSDLVARYGYLLPEGGGTANVASTPLRALAELLHPAQLRTAGLFLASSAIVGLAKPRLLVAVVPGLALALLSTHEPQRRLELHYAAELVPTAMVVTLLAAASLGERLHRLVLAGIIAAPALLAAVVLNPFGASHGTPPNERHRAAVLAAIALVPADEHVSVSAQSGLLPRLSQRVEAHEFPGFSGRADWVIVDRFGFRSSQSLDSGFETELARVRRSYDLVYSADGVEVFRRKQ